MTVDEAHLAELRRIAFGRTHSAEDEARAAAARHELEAALAARAAPIEVEPPDKPVLPVEKDEPAPESEAESSDVTPRARWILPATVALVVGLLLGAGAMAATGRGIAAAPAATPTNTFTAGSSGRPADVPPLSANHPVESSPGDVEAALAWFSGRQAESDKILEGMMAGMDMELETTRLVYTGPEDNVWIGQNAAGDICLLALPRVEGTGGGMCVTQAEFAEGGIALDVKGSLSIVWNGARLITSTNSLPQRDVRP